MQTSFGVNSPQAVKRWSLAMAVDYAKALYFKQFIGRDENSIIHEKADLKQANGDEVSFDLSMRLREQATYGDDTLTGKEEALRFMQDKCKIDLMRKATSAGGTMTNQRTLHDLRSIARARQSEFCAEWMDEALFIYLSGDVGIQGMNEDSIFGTREFAGNAITAPDGAHMMYGGSAVSKATLTAADTMSVDLIERVTTHATMLNATNPDVVAMRPIKIGGSSHFVVLMSPWQTHSMRTNTNDREWLEIQKAAGQRGASNPIFSGKLGMINNTVLHEHSNVRRFSDFGAGGNVTSARALFMGRQAGVIAYGKGSGSQMSWVEESVDYGSKVNIACGMVVGLKKTRYEPENGSGTDFGVIAMDTGAAARQAA